MLVERKPVRLKLVGLDSNIFALVGAFSSRAKREGWSREEIEKVQEAVTASQSYDQALAVLMKHCTQGGF